MRETCASLKGSSGFRPPLDIPTEGTRIRAVFDKLIANKGRCVTLSDVSKTNDNGRYLGQIMATLRDMYLYDIRLIRKGGHKRGPSLYCLVGKWEGDNYVDYVAEGTD